MPQVVVVTCADRIEQGEALANKHGAHLVCDWEMSGAITGHLLALRWAQEQHDRVIVMEDDAVPVAGFDMLSDSLLTEWPYDLVSMYLGTGYPDGYQPHIKAEIEAGSPVVELNNLIHGVCYSVPRMWLPLIIAKMDRTLPADFSIGRAWVELTGRPVIYPLPSLADHEDEVRAERSGVRLLPRRAWRLHQ